MVRMTYQGNPYFISPADVKRVEISMTPGKSSLVMRDGEVLTSDLPPDEVHAALFLPPSYKAPKVTKEMQEKLLAVLGQNSQGGGIDQWVPVDMGEPAKEFRSELAEALDPATYAKEWENHSPNCARAMAWALGLVRARLGVGK